jgi:transcriptional regulator with XRE-family HTH domain
MDSVDTPTLTFPERITVTRRRLGLTCEELGRRLGVSGKTVARWESGQNDPPFQKVARLAHLGRVPLEWLAEPVESPDATSGCIPRSQLRRFRLALDGDLAQLSLFGGAEPALPDPDEVNRVLCSLPGNDRRYHQVPVAVDRRHELAAA